MCDMVLIQVLVSSEGSSHELALSLLLEMAPQPQVQNMVCESGELQAAVKVRGGGEEEGVPWKEGSCYWGRGGGWIGQSR